MVGVDLPLHAKVLGIVIEEPAEQSFRLTKVCLVAAHTVFNVADSLSI
jgi:hypothetical protein